jgi:tetratricopeptide (TPR) repeat protein
MDELEAAGLLETSTGLAILSALFLLAAMYSWWSERRARKTRREKLLAALDAPPLRWRPPMEIPSASKAAPGEQIEPEVADVSMPADLAVITLLETDSGISRPVVACEPEPVESDEPDAREEDEEEPCAEGGVSAVVDELVLSQDDVEEIVAEPAEPRCSEEESSPEAEGDEPPASLDPGQLQRLDDLIEHGDPREARELLARLAEIAPQNLQLRRRAGRLALRCGRAEAAVRLLGACLEREPDDLQSRLDICAAHAELQNFQEVVRHARRGLDFPPKDGRLLIRLSEAAFELGAPEEALDLATEALRVRSEPESFFHLTRVLAMTRRLAANDAERLRLALERYPGEPALLHAAGVFEAMYGSRDAALRILRSASEREPTSRHHRTIDREIAALEASSEEHAA